MIPAFIRSLIGGKTVFPDAKHKITEAFVIDGVQYYQFDSIYNLPYKRGLAAVMVYEELKMKCDYELLKEFTKNIDKILNGNRISLNEFAELKRMNDIVMERLNWVTDIDLIYKLAAVVYFDKTESPYGYDAKYSFEKIQKWKKAEGVDDFFLRQPIQQLIPFLKGVNLNSENYFQHQAKENERHLRVLSGKKLDKNTSSSTETPSN